jgi:mannose-1-phosphate guanylyltransferase
MTAGILLVGGLGTRLKPLTNETPKPMLPIAGIPVTEHQILAAKKAGITTVVLATSYLSEVFTPYFGDGSKWGMKLLYAVEEEPLGTGGAIRNAAQLLGGDENVVIFNGDVLSHHDIAAQIKFHEEKKSDVTLHLISVEDARAFGCVPTDADGRVTAFLEKMDNPVTNSINAGCYVFNRAVINQIPLGKVVSVERETFPALVASGRPVFGYKEQSYWLDVGTPAALFKGSRDAVGAEFKVGTGSLIGPDCKISGGSSIGANCQIGQGVTIIDSIICDGVVIADGATIENSFLAPGAAVQAGAKILAHYLSKTAFLPISL